MYLIDIHFNNSFVTTHFKMQYRNKFDYQLLNLLNFQLKRNTVLVYTTV